MTPDRWNQILHVFEAALDRDATLRPSFLDEACQGDADLRAEVDALVLAHQEAGSFGERPLVVEALARAASTDNARRGSTDSPPAPAAEQVGRCSHCGGELVSEPGIPDWCPRCLLGLALDQPDPALGLLRPGRVLGGRYQLTEVLGRGGMGEVVRALDLRLRAEVALKAIRGDRVGTERARESLRQEVRSAREVVSPNVCRIYDLVVADGEELVSMEYVDGTTLAELLRRRRPLSLQEARDIAAQFLSGLEAIHRSRLVHRDFKPENIMITRAGRVVVMDFGLAINPTEGAGGTVSGTPAYMAPEQTRGDGVDARADVFAAGVVLAEMLMPDEGVSTRERVWRAVREVPPRVPDGPWAPVLRRALAAAREARFDSAHELARALETITQRLPGYEQRRPYPGLSAFTAEDAAYFFGREVETEHLLKKLEPPRLLALIGPSGAGKTSFLRAGLLPALPPLWRSVVTTPGVHPLQSLAQAFAPVFAGDADAVQALLRFDDEDTAVRLLQRLRERHEPALLIVDQFEELFTLNPPDTQAAFARLLGRLVVEADFRVVLSMRDDFFIHCHAHEPLSPAFSDLTPMGALGEGALRRALVQPALACGYRFEDDSLIDDMMKEVSQERGALPLLAFAAARLWDKRDRERGLLTRDAYREIGGVAGALAQHAEITLEHIGKEGVPIAREIFRNLVTAQGTRAVRERGDLLSVFDREPTGPGHRVRAEEVVSVLVSARLLNSYSTMGDGGESRQQIEIVHESLLTAWPRLVQWRVQDAEGAQVRDQLRQAAQLWTERGRSDDLLWSGTTYRELVVWRERYPGGLTETESAFAKAAGRLAARRRRRTRLAVGALLALVSTVAVATSILWQRSESSRAQAEAETRRAEAGKLLVMAEREIDRHPTAALAYTITSLQLADTEAGRHLAIRLLQQRPVARLAKVSDGWGLGNSAGEGIDFSPDGDWVAWGGTQKVELLHRDGQQRIVLGDYQNESGRGLQVRFAPAGGMLVANRSGEVRVWSVPDGRELRRGRLDRGRQSFLRMGTDAFFTLTTDGSREIVRAWPFAGGAPRLVGEMDAPARQDAIGQALAFARDGAVFLRSIERWDAPPRLIAELTTAVRDVALSPDAARVATSDGGREIRIWSATTRTNTLERVLHSPGTVVGLGFDPSGRWLFAVSFERGYPMLAFFDLLPSESAEPIVLHKGDTNNGGGLAFDPSGRWLATAHGAEVAFWPLSAPRGQTLALGASTMSTHFSLDGKRLFTLLADRSVSERSLDGAHPTRILVTASLTSAPVFFMAGDPSARHLAISGAGRLTVVRADDGSTRSLPGFPQSALVGRPAFSPDGRLLAAGLFGGPAAEKVVRVWDVETGAVRTFGPFPGAGEELAGGIASVGFAGPDRVYASVLGAGIAAIDLASGASRIVVPQGAGAFVLSRDGRSGVGTSGPAGSFGTGSAALQFDLEEGMARTLSSHGNAVTAVALDSGGTLVATGSFDGTIRVGPTTGEEPHLLLGQEGEGAIYSLAFSPDGRWLAASGESFAMHVWPVPDVSKPPLHRRAHEALLALLRSHTNLLAVPDPASPNGYKLERGPFPGWAVMPEW